MHLNCSEKLYLGSSRSRSCQTPNSRRSQQASCKSHVTTISTIASLTCLHTKWVTTHEPSNEHDLTGLRDNFNPRARWKAAIAGARALHRFGSSNSRLSGSTKSSGGWKTIDSDLDDDDDDEGDGGSRSPSAEEKPDAPAPPGENAFVQVTGPDGDLPPATSPRSPSASSPDVEVRSQDSVQSKGRPTSAHELKHEGEAHKPLEQGVPKELHEVHQEPQERTRTNPYAESEESLRMPGSFNAPEASGHHHHHGWMDLFKKLHIKS